MERSQTLTPPAEKKPAPRPVVPVEPPVAPPPPPQSGHDDEIDLNVPEPRPIWVVIAAIAGVVVLATLLLTGLIPRQQQSKELEEDAAKARDAAILVDAVRPHRGPAESEISMPANLRPWQETSIYARSTGYLKKFVVDISDQVKAGQLMAVIDAPELNQQLLQAQATLLQAKATVAEMVTNKALAQVTYDRFKKLYDAKSETEQDLDEKRSALDAADASVQAANASVAASDANVQRLAELKKFEEVYAPFDGVVTGRTYDVGSLILADPTTSEIQPMFKIAENDILRVFVNVPQSAALQIRKGMEVKITARERPGQTFIGTVMGTTNYLDQASRSLLTEVKVLNTPRPDGTYTLLPGMYVQVGFVVKHEVPPLVVPGPAIVNNADGTQVAIVRNGTVHFQKVTLGEDFGNEVEVVGGLTGDELVIANPGERVVEGVTVRTVATPPLAAPATEPTASATVVHLGGRGVAFPLPPATEPTSKPAGEK
jgi:RND family efflux transporter MFP subunit